MNNNNNKAKIITIKSRAIERRRKKRSEKKSLRVFVCVCDAPTKQLAPFSYALKVNESQDKDVKWGKNEGKT